MKSLFVAVGVLLFPSLPKESSLFGLYLGMILQIAQMSDKHPFWKDLVGKEERYKMTLRLFAELLKRAGVDVTSINSTTFHEYRVPQVVDR